MRRLLIGLFVVVLGIAMVTPASAAPVLERVIMVSRHGVRAPTRTAQVLESLTKRGWPVWPLGAGEMTDHGAKALGFMADFLHATYMRSGVLPEQGCPTPGTVEVWADALDNRTRQSGDIFAQHLAPGCGLASRFIDGGKLDPVFDASKSEGCPIGLLSRGGALLAATREKTGLLRPEDRRALAALQDILAPDACPTGKGVCLIPDKDASSIRAGATLGLGAMVAEGIYLEYVEGLPLKDVGWGKIVDAETIRTIMPVHERGIDILRRTPALAARRGSIMARTILAFIQGGPLPAGAPPLSSKAKLVMLAGHDSNLLYLAALMGLDWRLPGQPTMTPPDATLTFEVWRDPATAGRTLHVLVYGQTLAQLRDAIPLDASHKPDVVTITPDSCTPVGAPCQLETFTKAVEERIAKLCDG